MRSVTIRGVTYKSAAAASRALGVSKATIGEALRRNTLDNVGLGINHYPVWCCKEITIGGVTYSTQTEASRALKVNNADLSFYLKWKDRVDRNDAGDVVVDGTWSFKTCVAAAKHFDVDPNVISGTLRVKRKLSE